MGRKFEVRKVAMMKTGLAKSRLYSRFGKEIYMSAKAGGSNLESNSSLKHLVEKAKKVFGYSILYLFLIFVLLLIDSLI